MESRLEINDHRPTLEDDYKGRTHFKSVHYSKQLLKISVIIPSSHCWLIQFKKHREQCACMIKKPARVMRGGRGEKRQRDFSTRFKISTEV